jgi:predicted Zn-dependent protease
MRSRARREGDEPDAVEPIRTRTMARLLAAQGYPRRALAILQELHVRDPEDTEVQALIAQITTGRL